MNIKSRHLKYIFTTPIPTLLRISANIIRSKLLTLRRVKLEDELREGQTQEPIFPSALFRANMIEEHEFDILGSGPINLGKNIDWQKDFSGRNEIKVPWELSRFQFLSTLIKAYETQKVAPPRRGINCLALASLAPDNPKYAEKAKELIRDWILKNPLGEGVNWQSSMEAAIRACNFSLAWFFLKNTDSWKEKNWQKTFLTSIVEHGKFILRNLEYGPGFNTNHLIAGLTGLLFLGILFPQFREARKWKAVAIKDLENEIQNQVYEDGVNFEASIPYHELVFEFFGMSALICQENEITFSPEFTSRLEQMFEFIFYYKKPNGQTPQIGDNDSGCLFALDKKHKFWLAAQLFPLNTKFAQEYGANAQKSIGFNFGKIYIMRKNDFYCIVDAGEGGQNGNAGHAHNDTFSFELNVGGEDFIIDSGTYIYTGDPLSRNRFRSTRAHNTVTIDNEEMNRFRSNTVFSMHDDAKTQINKWDSNEARDILDAEHYGYKRLKNPVIHRRIFDFDKKNLTLKITDHFAGKGEHELSFNFHFAPGVEIKKTSTGIEISKNGIKIEIVSPQEFAIHDDEISPSYGVKIPSKTATMKVKCDISKNNNFDFIFRQL